MLLIGETKMNERGPAMRIGENASALFDYRWRGAMTF